MIVFFRTELDDEQRRAIRAAAGKNGLATRAEARKLLFDLLNGYLLSAGTREVEVGAEPAVVKE